MPLCEVLSVCVRPYTTGIFAIFAHLSETFVFIYMVRPAWVE